MLEIFNRVSFYRGRNVSDDHTSLNSRRGMVSFEDQYYDINRKLLTIVGLWPYQKWRFRIVQIILIIGALVSFLIAQFTSFVKFGFSVNFAIKVFAHIFPCLVYLLKYNSFLLNNKKIKEFFERIRREWTILNAPDEVNIIRKYANFSRLITLSLTALLLSFLMIFVLFQFTPHFLDVIAPLNKSRERHLPFVVEYYIDQKRYFYLILTHGLTAIFAGSIGVNATGTTLLAYILHICAMLKIARFADLILSSFKIFYLFLIGVGISSLTINLFQLLQLSIIMGDNNNVNGIIACGLLIIAHFFYLFLANLGGQIITDHNIDVFHAAYAMRWYTVSLQAQKLLLLILRKNTKNYCFVIGGIFVASLEGFATLTSMSISYFTVICSTRR